jgi:type II secretory ATPase GspE/PulE/Tfp pilus assembly ATPase PilB-like protein
MRAMRSEGGAIVLSGVVDSGKSTTISTLLSGVPSTRKVMTVEDPRENILPGSHFHQNTVSRDLESDDDPFKPKKRTLKRTALNDLFIGEIRDQQTAACFKMLSNRARTAIRLSTLVIAWVYQHA